MKLAKRRKSVAAVVVSLVALTAVVVAVVNSSSASESDPPPTGRVVSPKGEPPLHLGEPGEASSRFGVLRPATPAAAEGLPSSVLSVLANSGALQSDARTLNAVGTVEAGQGSEVTVADTSGELCLAVRNPELHGAVPGACSSLAKAEAGNGFVTLPELEPGTVRVIGLVPDGIERVGVDANGDGTPDQTVPVSSNVYQLDLKPANTTLLGLSKDGSVSFKVELPLAAHSTPAS